MHNNMYNFLPLPSLFTVYNSPADAALALVDPRGDGGHDEDGGKRWDELADALVRVRVRVRGRGRSSPT